MGWNRRRPLQNYRVAQRYEEYDPQGRLVNRRGPSGGQQRVPYATYVIMAICFAAYAVFNLGQGDVPHVLMMDLRSGSIFPGLITHMFMHADIGHLAGNMLMLFFYGLFVERGYGTPKFLVLYFGAGIVAALAQALADPGPALGASAALSGVFAAFVRHFPNVKIYLYFLIPMPAWVFGLLWLLFNLGGAIFGFGLNWGFTAHIVGLLAGFALSFLLIPPGRSMSEA